MLVTLRGQRVEHKKVKRRDDTKIQMHISKVQFP